MVQQFVHHPRDHDRWDNWDSLTLPVLCLRGADSDSLAAETLQQMARRKPRAPIITIAGCGHAPALDVPEKLAWVSTFLR